jgi:hypothetical protein
MLQGSVSDASRPLDLDSLAVDRVESDAFGGPGGARHDGGRVRWEIAAHYGASWPIAHAAFAEHVRCRWRRRCHR